MNEKAIQDAYDLFAESGYRKSIDDFKSLIKTNPKALNDSYELFKGKGYNKDIESYKSLVGVSQPEKKNSVSTGTAPQKVSATKPQTQPTTLVGKDKEKPKPTVSSGGVSKQAPMGVIGENFSETPEKNKDRRDMSGNVIPVKQLPKSISKLVKDKKTSVEDDDKDVNTKQAQGLLPPNSLLVQTGVKNLPIYDETPDFLKVKSFDERVKEQINPLKTYDKKPKINYENLKKTKDLDLPNPYLYFSKSKEGNNQVNEFYTENISNLPINKDDFDGFLRKEGYINDINKDIESGLYKKDRGFFSENYNEELIKEKRLVDYLSLYIDDKNQRDYDLRVINYKQQNPNATSKDVEENVQKYTFISNEDLTSYIEQTFPVYTKNLKERKNKEKEEWEETKKNKGDFFSWQTVKKIGSGVSETLVDRISNISSTVYDLIGLDNTASQIRFSAEQDAFNRPENRDISYVSGKKTSYNGVEYLVDSEGQVYDYELKKRVTDLFTKTEYDGIVESSKKGVDEDLFSWVGATVQTTNVVADLAVQIALTRGASGASSLAMRGLSKEGLSLLSKIPVSNAMASSATSQTFLGYSEGLESTLLAAKNAGINDTDAKAIANDAAMKTAALYLFTSGLSPQTKAAFNKQKNDLIKEAIDIYAKKGKPAYIKFLNNGINNLGTFLKEGGKETGQELIQEFGTVYGINPSINEAAGKDIVQTEMTVDQVISMLPSTFVAGGIPVMLRNVGGIFSRKDYLSNLDVASTNVDLSNKRLDELLANNTITKDEHFKSKEDLRVYSQNKNKIPKDTSADIVLDVAKKLDEISKLEASKNSLDKTFHEKIDQEINNKRAEIKDLYEKQSKEATVLDTLSGSDLFKAKDKASRELLKEANEIGETDIKITDEQITKRAIENYEKQSKETTVKEPTKEGPTGEQEVKPTATTEGKQDKVLQETKDSVEELRKQELVELRDQVENAEDFITDGKVDAKKVAESDNAKAKEIYAKYDAQIKPLLDNIKTQEDAIQKQSTGKVPVQPETTVSGEVEQGEPQAESEVATKKGKEKVTKYVEELKSVKNSDPETYWSVSSVTSEEASKGTVIDTKDGSAMVKSDGDIVGVFKKLTSKAKGVAQDLLKKAVEAGGTKLDNFDGYLTNQYKKAGFRVVSRTPFNEEFAPEGWNKEKHGTPDVVAMVYDPNGEMDIEEKTFDNKDTGYDEMIAYRDKVLQDQSPKFSKSKENLIESDVETVTKEMNKMSEEISNFDVPSNLTTKNKVNIKSLLSRFGNKLKNAFKGGIIKDLSEYNGIPMIFTISDQLSSGNIKNPFTGNTISLNGGLGFNLTEGNEDNAWANTAKAEADGMLSRALEVYNNNKPLFERLWKEGKLPNGHIPMVVLKMGQESIMTNEALFRTASDIIKKKFGVKERTASLNALVTSLSETSENKKIVDFIKENNFKTIDQLLDNITELKPIGLRGVVTKSLFVGNISLNKVTKAGKPTKPAAVALMSNKGPEFYKYLNLQTLNNIIQEESTKQIPAGHIIGIVGVDVLNPEVTKPNHKNYPFGVKGQLIGIAESPIHAADVFPEMYSKVFSLNKENKGGKLPSPEAAVSQSVAVGGTVASTKSFRGAKMSSKISDIQKLIGKLKLSFPSVTVVDTQEEFDAAVNSPEVKKFVSKGDIIYGFVKDGTIFLNPSQSNLNTPIHEFAHVWMNFMKLNNPKLLQKGFDLLEGSDILKKKIAEFGDTELAREEALAELIATRGETIIEAGFKSKFKNWLNAVFSYVKKNFKSFDKLSAEELQDISLNQFVDGALSSLLGGKEITSKEVKDIVVKFSKESAKNQMSFNKKRKAAITNVKQGKFGSLTNTSKSNKETIVEHETMKVKILNLAMLFPKIVENAVASDLFEKYKEVILAMSEKRLAVKTVFTAQEVADLYDQIIDDYTNFSDIQNAILSENPLTKEQKEFYDKNESSFKKAKPEVEIDEDALAEKRQEMKDEVMSYIPSIQDAPKQYDTKSMSFEITRLLSNINSSDLDMLSNSELENLRRVLEAISLGEDIPSFANNAYQIIVSNRKRVLSDAISDKYNKTGFNRIPLRRAFARITDSIRESLGEKSWFSKTNLESRAKRYPLVSFDAANKIYGMLPKFADIINGQYGGIPIYSHIFSEIDKAEGAFDSRMEEVNEEFNNPIKALDLKSKDIDESFRKIHFAFLQLQVWGNPGNKKVKSGVDSFTQNAENLDSPYTDKERSAYRKFVNKYRDYQFIRSNEKVVVLDPSGVDVTSEYFTKEEINMYNAIRSELDNQKARAEETSLFNNKNAMPFVNEYFPEGNFSKTASSKSINEDPLAQNFSKSGSLKSKNLEEKTTMLHPVAHNPAAIAYASIRSTELQYQLLNTIQIARMTMNGIIEDNKKKYANETDRKKKERFRDLGRVYDNIRDAVNNLADNFVRSSIGTPDAIDNVSDALTKTFYVGALASGVRTAADLALNYQHLITSEPVAISKGISERRKISSIIKKLGVKSPDKFYRNVLKFVDASQVNRMISVVNTTSVRSEFNAEGASNRITRKGVESDVSKAINKVTKVVEPISTAAGTLNDLLISVSDNMPALGFYVGAFSTYFKEATGQDFDYEKANNNDVDYMLKNRDAIQDASMLANFKLATYLGSKNISAKSPAVVSAMRGQGGNQIGTKIIRKMNYFFRQFQMVSTTQYLTALNNMFEVESFKDVNKNTRIMLGSGLRTSLYTAVSTAILGAIWNLFKGDDEDEEIIRKNSDELSLDNKFVKELFTIMEKYPNLEEELETLDKTNNIVMGEYTKKQESLKNELISLLKDKRFEDLYNSYYRFFTREVFTESINKLSLDTKKMNEYDKSSVDDLLKLISDKKATNEQEMLFRLSFLHSEKGRSLMDEDYRDNAINKIEEHMEETGYYLLRSKFSNLKEFDSTTPEGKLKSACLLIVAENLLNHRDNSFMSNVEKGFVETGINLTAGVRGNIPVKLVSYTVELINKKYNESKRGYYDFDKDRYNYGTPDVGLSDKKFDAEKTFEFLTLPEMTVLFRALQKRGVTDASILFLRAPGMSDANRLRSFIQKDQVYQNTRGKFDKNLTNEYLNKKIYLTKEEKEAKEKKEKEYNSRVLQDKKKTRIVD